MKKIIMGILLALSLCFPACGQEAMRATCYHIGEAHHVFCIPLDQMECLVIEYDHEREVEEEYTKPILAGFSAGWFDDLRDQYARTGYAEWVVYEPTLQTPLNWEYGLWLVERHMGNVLIESHFSLAERADMYETVEIYKRHYDYKDGVLRYKSGKFRYIPIEITERKLNVFDCETIVQGNGLEVCLYVLTDSNAYFAVIKDPVSKYPSYDIDLYIGEKHVAQVSGEIINEERIEYVCPLTTEEAGALRTGEALRLIPGK